MWVTTSFGEPESKHYKREETAKHERADEKLKADDRSRQKRNSHADEKKAEENERATGSRCRRDPVEKK